MTTLVPVEHRRSAFDAFNCPRRYKALYIDGVPDESDAARRGSAFHAAAARYIGALRRVGRSEDYELAAAALRDGIAESVTPAHLVTEVESIFWRWAETFELDLQALLVVEERQRDADGFTWTPDLVYAHDDLIELRDWKTHWKPFTEDQAHKELQAQWYVWQASKLWPGFQRYRIVFVFVRWGVEVSAEFDQADIDQIEARIDAIAGAIREAAARDEWPAIPGQQCSYCSLSCPVADHPDRVPLRFVTRADAERAGALKLALDRAATQVDQALRVWCDAHGPLLVGGMEIGFRPSEKVTFPAAAAVDVLRAHEIPADDVTLSKSALRRYLTTKKFAYVREALEALACVKPGSRFGAKKAGELALDAGDDEE